MNLIIDIGNTLSKISLFEKGNCIKISKYHQLNIDLVQDFIRGNKISRSIICTTGSFDKLLYEYLIRSFPDSFIMGPHLKLPVKVEYETPQTLGADRLAVVCGAYWYFQNSDVLVINAGSCITYDYVNADGDYKGGSISPGLQMRFKALNTFTHKLPLIEPQWAEIVLTGKNTADAILSGVQNGILMEIGGIVEKYNEKYPGLKVIICGGDAPFLSDKLKIPIFADPDFLLFSLDKIIYYNVS